jgi:hypothetical protein
MPSLSGRSRGFVRDPVSDEQARATRALLACGVIAGPFYIAVGAIQVFIRPGFDIRRHALSLLSNGNLGWIQIANFAITGALLLASAVGMRRALRGTRGGTWGPLLLGLYGVGLIGAAMFTADPGMGFPPGAPEQTIISTRGLMHLVTGSIGFLGFVASCFVFARRFGELAQPQWKGFSLITGVLFLAAFLGIASGSKGGVSLPFALAVVLGFTWISMVMARLRRGV